MHQAIVDYKLKRQSLRSLVDTIEGSFDIASDGLRAKREVLRPHLDVLAEEASAAEPTSRAAVAIDTIDAVLADVR
jgi:hypothetical protein